MNAIFALLLWMALSTPTVLHAEQPPHADTESTVPELVDFHDIIYPIWHDAYPKKNYAALRGYAAQVMDLFSNVERAKLPGILREKQVAWDKGLAELKAAVEAYGRAAAGTDNEALLDAAERIHACYEVMVRIIRPANKAVDAFHRLLYVVYHTYLPEKQYGQIKDSLADLKAAAEAIRRSPLPRRLEAKGSDFRLAAQKLLDEVGKLDIACATGEGQAIAQAVEALHSAYVELNSLFE